MIDTAQRVGNYVQIVDDVAKCENGTDCTICYRPLTVDDVVETGQWWTSQDNWTRAGQRAADVPVADIYTIGNKERQYGLPGFIVRFGTNGQEQNIWYADADLLTLATNNSWVHIPTKPDSEDTVTETRTNVTEVHNGDVFVYGDSNFTIVGKHDNGDETTIEYRYRMPGDDTDSTANMSQSYLLSMINNGTYEHRTTTADFVRNLVEGEETDTADKERIQVLTDKLAEVQADLAIVRTQRDNVAEATLSDTLEKLGQEAEERSWCSEYDEFLEKNGWDRFNTRAREVTVTGTFSVTVTVGAGDSISDIDRTMVHSALDEYGLVDWDIDNDY